MGGHTYQPWIKEDGIEKLERLIKFLMHEAEVEFNKNIERARRTEDGKIRRRLLQTLIKPEEINDSFVLREALDYYWNKRQPEVVEYEKDLYWNLKKEETKRIERS